MIALPACYETALQRLVFVFFERGWGGHDTSCCLQNLGGSVGGDGHQKRFPRRCYEVGFVESHRMKGSQLRHFPFVSYETASSTNIAKEH